MGKKQMGPELAAAEQILGQIGMMSEQIRELCGEAEAELTKLQAEYQEKVRPYEMALKEMEKTLRQIMKKNLGVIFGGRQGRVDLPSGALLYQVVERVKKARGVLEKLKEQGIKEAIKIAESVDWEKLEEWPEERLLLVGTERVQKEEFDYELKAGCAALSRPTDNGEEKGN